VVILGVAASVYFATTREPKTDRIPDPPPTATPRTDIASTDEPAVVPATPTAAATAKIDELNASSETFRNTTFVVAIRGAGFFCDDVADVYQGDTGSGTWRVSCRDMRAYTIGVGDDGALGVEPVLHLFDAPRPIPDINTPPELRDLLR
jgi:hypothetical protein